MLIAADPGKLNGTIGLVYPPGQGLASSDEAEPTVLLALTVRGLAMADVGNDAGVT
jgi:hypothetical protein